MKRLDYFEMTNLVDAYYKNEHTNPKNGVEVGIIIEDMLNNFFLLLNLLIRKIMMIETRHRLILQKRLLD